MEVSVAVAFFVRWWKWWHLGYAVAVAFDFAVVEEAVAYLFTVKGTVAYFSVG